MVLRYTPVPKPNKDIIMEEQARPICLMNFMCKYSQQNIRNIVYKELSTMIKWNLS